MKIGIVSSEFHPLNAAAAARSGSWASLFAELGHEVTVFSSCEAHSEKPNLVRSWFRTPDNRASVAKRLLQEVCLGLDLAFRIMLKAKKTEVNLITSPPFFMAAFCAFACRLAGVPYVLDVRDRYPNVLFELKMLSRDGWPGLMLLGLEKVICSSSFSSLRLRRAWSPICGKLLMGSPFFVQQRLRRKGFSRSTFVASSIFPFYHCVSR